MPIPSVLSVVVYWVAGFFVIASGAMCVHTIQNSMRLRGIRLAWNAGRLWGYPLFSCLFLGVMAVVTWAALSRGDHSSYGMVGAYTWTGLMWFVVSHLTSRRYLTDHGIVKNINEPEQTIAWNQIVDHVRSTGPRGHCFTFLFRETGDRGALTGPLLRIELEVPDRHLPEFQRLLDLKLGRASRPELRERSFSNTAD